MCVQKPGWKQFLLRTLNMYMYISQLFNLHLLYHYLFFFYFIEHFIDCDGIGSRAWFHHNTTHFLFAVTIGVQVLPPSSMLIGLFTAGDCSVITIFLWPLQVPLSSPPQLQWKSATILTSFYIQISTIYIHFKTKHNHL